MPRTARSPPRAAKKQVINQENDSASSTLDKSPVSVPQRSKRPRAEFSPGNDFSILRDEIKNMLAEWKTEQDAALSKLISEVSDLKLQNIKVQKTFLDIEKAVEFMSSKYEDFSKKIQEFDKEREGLHNYILNLESKIQDLQSNSRLSTLEVRNVPNNDKETTQDLISVVCSIGQVLKADISPSEIRDIYRGPGKPDTNKAIIVDLTSVLKKNQVISSIRLFNRNKPIPEKFNSGHIGRPGQTVPIFIDEHLPYSVKKLFLLCRNFTKQNDYKYCWSNNGRIFIRKNNESRAILIKSEKCLQNLEPQK
ncbi:unnamed protein product [Plutella xylostella]|uniref:(diamondback moth) hypothetical protein n=1 Tax=Plutella xylostella TaxID=51655 RepID=A0A8S4GEE3_PLUXY|nr:unnamed protein product [Plutella xylostella]